MRIGLIDVDSHNFPNLPLMKLSMYHKWEGDNVEWYNNDRSYDLVYMSKVFTDSYTKDYKGKIRANRVIKGGTGYGLKDELSEEVEHCFPDYSIYSKDVTKDAAYGFLTRGCPRNCKFCIVSKKEGKKSRKVADLNEFWNGQKIINLLDANLFACEEWESLVQQLIDSNSYIDFVQGIDIRLLNKEKVYALNWVKTKMLHFAWDNPKEDLIPYFENFNKWTDVKSTSKKCVYVLTNFNSTLEEDLYRIYTLRDMGYDPYVMVYEKQTAPDEIKRLQRWVNNRFIFKSCKNFYDYDPKYNKRRK